VSSQRLLHAAGALEEPGIEIDCELADVVVACEAGVVLLDDSPAGPIPARLRLTATDSRFVVGDENLPFMEQSGIADLDIYRNAAVWKDVRSRYEGGGPFLRIDGNFERFDEGFPEAFLRLSKSGDWPDPSAWSIPGG
jgi:hypothetical protein